MFFYKKHAYGRVKTPRLDQCRFETLGFEKRDRSHLFQTEMEDFLVTDTGRYYT